jgi:hypothetical protein
LIDCIIRVWPCNRRLAEAISPQLKNRWAHELIIVYRTNTNNH